MTNSEKNRLIENQGVEIISDTIETYRVAIFN